MMNMTMNIMNKMNKQGPNRRPRSSLPRTPAHFLGSHELYSVSLAYPRPYFDLLSRGEALQDKLAQHISMGARVSVRVVPNMEALLYLQMRAAVHVEQYNYELYRWCSTYLVAASYIHKREPNQGLCHTFLWLALYTFL